MGAACSKYLSDDIYRDLQVLDACIEKRTNVVTISKQLMMRICKYFSALERNDVPGDVGDFFSSTLALLQQDSKDPSIPIDIPKNAAMFIGSAIADQTEGWIPSRTKILVALSCIVVVTGIVACCARKGSSTVTEGKLILQGSNGHDYDSDAERSTAPSTPAPNQRRTRNGQTQNTGPTTDSNARGSTAPGAPATNQRRTRKGQKQNTGPTTDSNAASDNGSMPINSKKRSCPVILESNNRRKNSRKSSVVHVISSQMASMTTDCCSKPLNNALTTISECKNLIANGIPTMNS